MQHLVIVIGSDGWIVFESDFFIFFFINCLIIVYGWLMLGSTNGWELIALGQYAVFLRVLPDCVHVVLHLWHLFRVEVDLFANANLFCEENLVLGVVVSVGLRQALSNALLLNLNFVISLDKFFEVAL